MRFFLPRKACALTATIFLSLLLSSSSFSQTTAKQKLDAWLAKNATRMNLQSRDVSELFITNSFVDASTGIEHIYAQQRVNGVDVVGGQFALHSSTRNSKEYEADNLVKKHLH